MLLPATIEEWCANARVSRGTFYNLDPKPFHFHAGSQVRITETPEQYGARVAGMLTDSAKAAAMHSQRVAAGRKSAAARKAQRVAA